MKPALLVLALVTFVSGSAQAQAPGQPGEDPLSRYLYPPELVFDHQQAIGLSDAIRQKIQEAVVEAQRKFFGLQLAMGKETEALKNLLQGGSVDEDAVLKQIDQVLGVEREVKRVQLSLMIKIKNALTPEQQTTLRKIRDQDGVGKIRDQGGAGEIPVARLGAEEEPLVYIDGVLASRNIMKALNPLQIATVEVLKAMAAVARYGPRGAQGVILVTLKP